MSEGRFVDISGQLASWCIGSFINRSKLGRLRPAKKGSKGAAEVVPVVVLLVVVPTLGPGFPLVLGPGPDIVEVTGGRTRRKRRTQRIRRGVGVQTQRRTGSTTAGQSRSIDRKLRVKAKKSPGKVPWGHNDDRKKKDRQG